MSRPRKRVREGMAEWVLHCAVNQRHIRRSQPTREAALNDACAQLLQGHIVNRIVGPNETITAERVRDLVRKASTRKSDGRIEELMQRHTIDVSERTTCCT